MNNVDIELELEQKKEITESKIYRIPKRIMDIFGGIVGSLLTLPIIFFVKIAYLVDGDFAPIMFKQERIGKNGKRIDIYKFRTMIPNADEALFKLLKEDEEVAREYKRYKKLKKDPRITKVGNFLRKTSLDEFPQFFNVLVGNMSLVGPRPYLPREIEDMGDYFDIVVKSKPGITGYWQVNGRSNTDFGQRLVLDEYYSAHKSLWMDIKIIIKTVKQVFFKEGM